MKRCIFLCILCATSLHLSAFPIDSLFVNLPTHVLPQFERNVRLDMLDYWNYGQPARATATTVMHCDAQLTAKDSLSLTLQLSPTCRWQLVCLPSHDDGRYCVLQTPSNGACGTFATLYNSRWEGIPLSLPHIESTALCALPDSLGETRLCELKDQLNRTPVVWKWETERQTLTAEPAYAILSKADSIALKRYARPATARWNGKAFETTAH